MSNSLSQKMLYHEVQPQSVKDSYSQYDNVDFLISAGPNRSLVANSVRVIAELAVHSTGNTRTGAGIHFDPRIGGHTFIDSCQVNFSAGGLKENISAYPRYVAMHSVASLSDPDMLNGRQACELKATSEVVTEAYCNGITPNLTTATEYTESVDFSIKPMCALNKMSGGDLPFDRSGIVTLTLNLARNESALYGPSQTTAANYALSNLRCTFNTVPDFKTDDVISMATINTVKSNVLSGNANISANVNAVCNAVSISFLDQNQENVSVWNTHNLSDIKGWTETQYIMNSATNSLVTYRITDRTELLERFINSMYNSGHNSVSVDKYRANKGAGCMGLDFDGEIDLSVNRFTLQLASGVGSGTSVTPYVCWMFFHSRVQV
jgi:hypothetical protein